MAINIKELCQAIAEALGPEWSVRTPEEDQHWCSDLVRADGMVLCCRKARDRVEVIVDGMESITEEGRIIFRYHHGPPSITVSATRDPKAIARDIRNRLLPEATAWWEEGMKGKAKAEQEHANKLQLRNRLLQLFPGATLTCGPLNHNEARISTTDNAWIVYPSKHCVTFNRMSNDEIVALIEAYHQLKGTP